MKKFYDSVNKRLVYVDRRANDHFWDSHWEKYNVAQMIKSAVLNRMVLVPTRKYLLKGARILEGGCGLGQNVWSLHRNGYDVYGVDYAPGTVERVNLAVPELKVIQGDIRDLVFEDDFFDGYWSLGVIEHFYDGFGQIVSEMKRVIKPGGFLFLTFPCMSKFRYRKVGQNKYLFWKESQELLAGFYQFALPVEKVKSDFIAKGFELVKSKPIGGLKGFKDELYNESLKRLLQQLYDSKNFTGRVLAWGLDQIFAPFAGHSQLLILKNLK